MKYYKDSFRTFFAFIISPFLSVPFLVLQLRNRKDYGVIFVVSLLYSILSFNYIAHISNDKARYIERASQFNGYSFSELIDYYKNTLRPDYVFDFINYVFSKSILDTSYFFLVVTFVTVFSTLTCVKKLILLDGKFSFSNKTFLFILFSISLPGLFSGVRFALAGSIFVWFIYSVFFKKDKKQALFLLMLAIATHFSFIYLVLPVFCAIFLLKIDTKLYYLKFFLVLSLFFHFVPQSFIVEILSAISFPASYIGKISIYSISENIDTSDNAKILNILKFAWYYFAIVFLLFYKPKGDKKFYFLLVTFFIFINIVNPIPTAFYRYLTFTKIIFSAYIINAYLSGYFKSKFFMLFFFLFFIGFMIDLLILRVNFFESYSFSNSLTIFHIIISEKTKEFLY